MPTPCALFSDILNPSGVRRRSAKHCFFVTIQHYSEQEKKRLSSPSDAVGDPVFLSSKIWIPAKNLPE
jgi:hypothetical protein